MSAGLRRDAIPAGAERRFHRLYNRGQGCWDKNESWTHLPPATKPGKEGW